MDSTDIALKRANAYRFFSLIYAKEPSPKFIEEIKKQPIRGVLENLGVVFDELFDNEDIAPELGYEYVRLFIGTGSNHATPYESVFRDEWNIEAKKIKRLMWGDSTIQVVNAYQKAGFRPEPKFKDIPDHLAVELGFIEKLCRLEAEAIKTGDRKKINLLQQKQVEFLKDHVLLWFDKFAEEVARFATLQFYKSIAQATAQFLKSDYEELKKSV